jgi:hypothetical protein
MSQETGADTGARWTFLSNHGHVLLCIARDPGVTLREVADRVGITERAVQRIVADLEEGRYIERTRTGRRNHYEVHLDLPLRHPVEAHRPIRDLLALVMDLGAPPVSAPAPAPVKARPPRKTTGGAGKLTAKE